MASPTKLARDNTMEATAKEGIEYLEKNRPDLAEQVKAVAKETPENGAGDAPKATKNGDSPAKLPRDNTMVTTAEEGKEYLEKHGGVNAEAKTRSQEADLNNSANQSPDKTATKRAADDEPEAEAEDAKKQKTEEEEEDGETKEEEKKDAE